jgi:integrase
VRPKLRPRTLVHYEEIIEGMIVPRFGTWRLNAITESDVSGWHSSLAETPTRANRALAILSSLMSWVVRNKLLTTNPCQGITRFREQPVNRYPTVTDLDRIVSVLDELLLENAVNPLFAAGVKVMIMSGARRSEIFEAQWAWLDSERRCLVLPDSKTGAKSIALPSAAFDIILALPRLNGCRWIFPSTKTDRPFVNFSVQWKPVLDRAAVGRWRLHDLRHGFASAAVASGAPIYIVGRQLGHVRPATTSRYAHVADQPKHDVAESVATSVLNLGAPMTPHQALKTNAGSFRGSYAALRRTVLASKKVDVERTPRAGSQM